jgi:hypothetical protein
MLGGDVSRRATIVGNLPAPVPVLAARGPAFVTFIALYRTALNAFQGLHRGDLSGGIRATPAAP